MIRYVLAASSLLCLNGCYSYTPVEVHIVDVETEGPMVGVTVSPRYRRMLEFFPPNLDPVTSDANGVARLDVCNNYKSDYAGLYVEFPGYRLVGYSHPYSVDLSVEQLREATEPVRVELELTSEPLVR